MASNGDDGTVIIIIGSTVYRFSSLAEAHAFLTTQV